MRQTKGLLQIETSKAKRPILLIDSNYLCHRARFTTGALEHKGERTGVVFGFLNQVHQLAVALAPSNVVFVWDTRGSVRKERFPFYKEKRRSEPDPNIEKDYAQFNSLRDSLIPQMGFLNSFQQEGYEADDIIAAICQSTATEEFIIASSDEDLLQLLSRNTSMYNLGKRRMDTYYEFRKQYGVHPKKWVDVKKLAGCSSDNVPGIPGIGEKTALLYLTGNLKSNSKKMQLIESNPSIPERNDWLVRLPLPGTVTPVIQNNQFQKKELLRICQEFGFFKFIQSPSFLEDWEIYFGQSNNPA